MFKVYSCSITESKANKYTRTIMALIVSEDETILQLLEKIVFASRAERRKQSSPREVSLF